MRGAVQSNTAGLDGATFRTWLRGVADQLRYPLRFLTIDFTRKDGPVAQHERFEALKSVAASGHAGCMAARKRLKMATNRGLAAALRRELPEVLSQ